MAQHSADLHLGDIALENVKVCATDRGGDHLHDHIGRLLDRRVRYFFPALLTRTLVDECLHDGPPAAGNPSSALRLARPASTWWRAARSPRPRLRTAQFAG